MSDWWLVHGLPALSPSTSSCTSRTTSGASGPPILAGDGGERLDKVGSHREGAFFVGVIRGFASRAFVVGLGVAPSEDFGIEGELEEGFRPGLGLFRDVGGGEDVPAPL